MDLQFIRHKSEDYDRWDNFVWQAVNGTIFHTRRFLSYHPRERFVDHSLEIYLKGKLFALFPAVEREEAGKRILHSHQGATYGSFVYKEGLSLRKAYQLVEGLLHYAKDNQFQRIILTLPPIIYQNRLSNYLDFALLRHGFRYLKREVSSILYLEENPELNLKKFKQTARTATRKAFKLGIVVRESDDFATFYQILKNNLKIRHNVQPTHTLDELLKLKVLFPERIRLYAAFLRDKMVAGVVNFICNRDVILAFYISHVEKYQKYRAVNALFYQIINEAIREGYSYLDFGIFTVNMEPNFGLGRFKESFGASGIFRDTFYIDL